MKTQCYLVSRTPTSAPGGYDVAARLSAFIVRHREVRVIMGASDTSTFTGFTLPTPPSITSQTTADSLAAFNAARGNGVEITLTGAGFTGALSLNGYSDMRVIFPPGFTLTGPSGGTDNALDLRNINRIELLGTGGSVIGPFDIATYTDLKFKGMNFQTTGGAFPTAKPGLIYGGDRFLAEGCTIDYIGNPFLAVYCNEFIVANCDLRCRDDVYAGRTAGGGRTLIMDSRLRCNDRPGRGWRIHKEDTTSTTNAALWNLQILSGTGIASTVVNTETTPPQCSDLVIIDTRYYGDGRAIDASYTTGGHIRVLLGTYYGNKGYTDYAFEGDPNLDTGNTNTDWLLADNLRYAYQAPPAWTMQ